MWMIGKGSCINMGTITLFASTEVTIASAWVDAAAMHDMRLDLEEVVLATSLFFIVMGFLGMLGLLGRCGCSAMKTSSSMYGDIGLIFGGGERCAS